MASSSNFPVKTALAFVTALAALAVYRRIDPNKGLSPAIFSEAAHITIFRHDPSRAPSQPLNGVQQTTPGSTNSRTADNPCAANGLSPGSSGHILQKGIPHPPVSPYLLDECGNLDAFFAALHHLEAPGVEGPNVVTILHYGDSPTTADLITGDVRELLQQRFGDAGRGFLLTAKPWAWYQHRAVDLTDKNWRISTAVGKGRPETYGIGGASFEGDSSASSHITLKDPNQARLEIDYLAQPNGGTLAISANTNPLDTLSTSEDETRPLSHTVQLPPNTTTIDLHPTSGTVKVFGETLLSGRPGVLYDSLGLNGASTSVLSNGFNARAWQSELLHEKPALVIINYGTNESGFGAYVDKQYEPTLRTAIARIREVLPAQPILIMSPMDRGRRSGVDQIETYDTIPRIVAIQRRVAAELNCAFFDTFNAMGGDGTMSRWYTGHPRLVAGDLIHPTPQGAALVAHLFVHDLGLAYDQYLGHPQAAQNSSTRPTSPLLTRPQLPVPTSAGPVTQTTLPPPPSSKPKPPAAGEPLPRPAPQASSDTNPQPTPSPPPETPQA